MSTCPPVPAVRAAAAAAVVLATLLVPSAGAVPRSYTAVGTAVAPGCLPGGAGDYDPQSSRFRCTGKQELLGDWQGQGDLAAAGVVGLVTGDARGTFTDRLAVTLTDGTAAQLVVRGRFVVDGATGQETLRGVIVSGTGHLRRAVGSVVFSGYSPATGGPAEGSYEARWRVP